MDSSSSPINQATALSSPTQPRTRKNDGTFSTSTSNQSFQSSSSKLLQVEPITSPTSSPIALGDISAEMASEIIETRPDSSNSNNSNSNSDQSQSTQLPHRSSLKSTTLQLKSLAESRGIDSHHPILTNSNLKDRNASQSNSPPSSSGIGDVFLTPTTNLTPSDSQSLLTPRIGTHGHAIPPPRSESTTTDPSDQDDLSRTSTDRDSYYYEELNQASNVGINAMDRELKSLTYENLSASFGENNGSKATTPKIGGFGVRDNHVPQGMRSKASEKLRESQSSPSSGFGNDQMNGRTSRSSNSTNSSAGGIGHQDPNLRTPPRPQRSSTASSPPVTPNPNEWASNFWCVITDPVNGQSFFANPETGMCCWQVPSGTFVLPENPEGQWWELTDEVRGLNYFYHTSTKVSTWIKPAGFVIPLTAIQESTLGRRFSRTELGKNHLSALASSSGDEEVLSTTDSMLASSSIPPATSKRLSQPPAPSHNPSIEQVLSFKNEKGQTMGSRDDLMANAMAGGRTRALGSRLSSAANGAHFASSSDRPKIPVVQLEPPSSPPSKNRSRSSSSPHSPPREDRRPSASRMHSSGTERKGHIGNHSSSDPSGDLAPSERSLDLSTLSSFEISAPIRRERDPAKRNGPLSLLRTRKVSTTGSSKNQNQKNSKSKSDVDTEPGVARLSTGEHRILPSPLADEIRKVNFSGFAKANFSPHRAGILRRKTPTHKLSSFQNTPISAALLPLPKELQKDAVKIFKVILRICGDRDAPVHSKLPPLALTSYGTVPDRNATSSPGPGSPRPVPTRKSSSGLGTPVGAGIQSFGTPTKNGHHKDKSDDSFSQSHSPPPTVLEEERWLLERGIIGGPKLRDEIYVQVLKQLSENPSLESSFRCWQLLCVLLDTFPPTSTFHSYLRDFIEGHAHLSDLSLSLQNGTDDRDDRDAITAMARHCLGSLSRVQKRGARGKAPSLTEIECSSEKAFNPTVFGLKLEEVMEVQQKAYPEAKVPIICTFLTEALLAVGAEREGIFRVAGDSDIITELKVRIERGQYTLHDLSGFDADSPDAETDVAVLTSLLKLWLRELESPLIPSEMYHECLSVANTPQKAVALVSDAALPVINRRVLLFVISFLQLFCLPSVVKKTKMTPESIALVWSPNILRNESSDLSIAYPNSRLEQSFVKQLLLHLDCQAIDEEYQPPHHVEKSELLEAIKIENEKNSTNSKTNSKSNPPHSTVDPSPNGKPQPHLYGRALSPITDDTESVTTDSTAPGRNGLL